MKFFVLVLSILTIEISAFASDICGLGDSDAIVSPVGITTVLPTFCVTNFTKISVEATTGEDVYNHALFIEAAPLAANFLVTGTGLENPALVQAMHILYMQNQGHVNSAQELALRVIEEANR